MATNPLLDLPHELIESVAGFLPAADLAHLAATCRGLNGICEPLLYATATLDDLEAAAGFGEALAALPVRAKQVVSLQVGFPPREISPLWVARLTGGRVRFEACRSAATGKTARVVVLEVLFAGWICSA